MKHEKTILSEIADPIDFYLRYVRETHLSHIETFFNALCKDANIDKEANNQLVAKLRVLEAKIKEIKNKRLLFFLLMTLSILAAAYIFYCIGTVPEGFEHDPVKIIVLIILVLGVLGIGFGAYRLLRSLQETKEHLLHCQVEVEKKRKSAWAQMAPLNKLFKWDIGLRLIEKTLPLMTFDNFLHQGRLKDLEKNFGLKSDYGQKTSFLETCSGSLCGYPFIFSKILEHLMGLKTYHGSLTIRWKEKRKNAQGQWETIEQSQTLTASVTKAYPRYHIKNFMIYGHDAAPHLNFTRKPSSLSHLGDDWLSQKRKKWAERRLEKKSLKSKGNFTAMTNREFDAMFGAEDRNHETEFRLLFTPLAQRNMQKLLQDKGFVGYGDNFTFRKIRKINILTSKQLEHMDMSGDVTQFRGYDFAEIQHNFMTYQKEFMRGIYFTFAPLFTIPLYLEKRVKSFDYGQEKFKASLWEAEVIANSYGENSFKHPKSCTKNILKAEISAEDKGTQSVKITAHGYRRIRHISHISVHGRDGKYHQVPVIWYEYLAVEKISHIIMAQKKEALHSAGVKYGITYRRGLFYALMR